MRLRGVELQVVRIPKFRRDVKAMHGSFNGLATLCGQSSFINRHADARPESACHWRGVSSKPFRDSETGNAIPCDGN